MYQSIASLGWVHHTSQEYGAAVPYYVEGFEGMRAVLGEGHTRTRRMRRFLLNALAPAQRYAEAEAVLREAVRVYEAELGWQHPEFGTAQYELARVVTGQGRLEEAEVLLRECIETGLQAGEDWGSIAGTDRAGLLAHVRSELGGVLTSLNRFDEAEDELHAAESVLSETAAAARRPAAFRQKCLARLVALYEPWEAAEPDQGHDASAAAWCDRLEMR